MNEQELNKASQAAFNVHTNRTFAASTDEELKQMLIALVQMQAKGLIQPWVKQAIGSFENEISRRTQLGGSTVLHQQQMEQGKNLHGETMGELEQLKKSVNQLARARRIDWAILIAGTVAAIATVILLFRGH